MTRRILPPTYVLIALLAMLALHVAFPVTRIALAPWSLCGMLILGAGLAINVWGAGTFGRVGTTINSFGQPAILVTEGLFRYSRNPMYLGMALILIGSALALGTLTPWLVIPVFIWTINAQVIHFEEGQLEAVFGEQYRAYRARVRRWI